MDGARVLGLRVRGYLAEIAAAEDPAPSLRVDAVWDIETAHWDEFVCGALWTAATDTVEVYDDEDELARALLDLPKGAVAWAHAGGKFDVLWLLDWCRRRAEIPSAQIRLSGGSITSLAIKNGPVLRDSARLMPMSLRDACTMFPGCAQKERLSFPCTCGEDCGGYCAISRRMPRTRLDALKAYMAADVLALRDTLQALASYADDNELKLAGTVATTGWRTALATCPNVGDAEWEIEAYRMARAGYYGGLCAVGKTRAARIYRFDRKQAYPAALKLPVPCGEMTMLDTRTGPKAWKRDRPGCYFATVEVPEMHVPPLPVRLRDRIVYPWGRLTGTWTRDELERATEVGCNVARVHGGIAWATEKPLLAPHVDKCFALRESAQSSALKTWLKFVANSLTGAFAQDPAQDVVALGDYADDPAYEPVGRYDWIWRREVFRISQRAHVHWAATLTARARVELHRQIEHAGSDWVYSDTDSCHATRKLTRNIGTDLGEWAPEGEATDFVAVAPKVYSYRVEGKLHARAKGIPRAERAWPAIMSGDRVPLNRGVDSLLVAAKGDKLFRRRSGGRRVTEHDTWVGGRLRDGDDSTRAPHFDELASLPR